MKKCIVLALLVWMMVASIAATGHAQDETLQVAETTLLEELTDEQMDAFLAGTSPSDIELGNGESLEGFLHRLDQQTTGLLFHPVAPCIILDTRQSDLPLLSGEERALKWRGVADDKNGDNKKCGHTELVVNGASAALLSLQFFDSSGSGDLYLWSGGQDDRELDSSLTLSPDLSSVATVTASLCDPPSTRNCEAADLRLRLDGADSQVIVRVLGYFVPPSRPTRGPEESDAASAERGPDRSLSREKSLESPFWEPADNAGKIHYSDGFVGIGTSTPWAPLHIEGRDLDYPDNQALKITTHGARNYWNHISISGDTTDGFGIGFSGLGHTRGGIYARNIGGEESATGEITLWARANGRIRMLGGSVGIGVNPGAMFHVGGDALFDLGEGLAITGTSDYWGTNLDARRIRIRDWSYEGIADGGLVFETWTSKDDQSFPLLTLRRYSDTPNVGIGTAFPDNPLAVHGNRIQGTGTISSTGASVSGVDTSFLTDLRVGSELIVDGQVRKVTEVLSDTQLSLNTPFIPDLPGSAYWYSHRVVVVDEQGRMRLGRQEGSPEELLHLSSTGDDARTRIRLEVNGDDENQDASILFVDRNEGDGTYWSLGADDSKDVFRLSSSTELSENTRILVSASGRVGIGTDTPDSKLDVAGNIRLEGNLYNDVAETMEVSSEGALHVKAKGDICIGRCE